MRAYLGLSVGFADNRLIYMDVNTRTHINNKPIQLHCVVERLHVLAELGRTLWVPI